VAYLSKKPAMFHPASDQQTVSLFPNRRHFVLLPAAGTESATFQFDRAGFLRSRPSKAVRKVSPFKPPGPKWWLTAGLTRLGHHLIHSFWRCFVAPKCLPSSSMSANPQSPRCFPNTTTNRHHHHHHHHHRHCPSMFFNQISDWDPSVAQRANVGICVCRATLHRASLKKRCRPTHNSWVPRHCLVVCPVVRRETS